MYDEDDLISISGLQHVLYCERQFALIHIEQLWQDNRFECRHVILGIANQQVLVRDMQMPATPERIWRAIRSARRAK